MKHTCCNCLKKFEKVPYGPAGINVVLDSDDYETHWDLKDMIRKSDRKMVLNVNNPMTDEIILCVDCYDQIIEEMISRIKDTAKV